MSLYVNIVPHASKFKNRYVRRAYIVVAFVPALIENLWNTVVGTFSGAATWWNADLKQGEQP